MPPCASAWPTHRLHHQFGQDPTTPASSKLAESAVQAYPKIDAISIKTTATPAIAIATSTATSALVEFLVSTLPTIAGHREAAATQCPGGTLYKELPAIRHQVATRMTAR